MNKKLLVFGIVVLLLAVGLSGCTSKPNEPSEQKIVIKDYEITIDSADIDEVRIGSIDVLLRNEGDSSVRLGYIVLTSGESEIKSFLVFDSIEAGEEKRFSESTYGYLDRKIGTETLNATLSVLTTYSQKVITEKNIIIPIPFIKVGDTIPEVGSSHNMSMTILSWKESDISMLGYGEHGTDYYTFTAKTGMKFIILIFEFQNNWIREQTTPYVSAGDVSTDKGYIYSLWHPPIGIDSEEYNPRKSTEEEIKTLIGDSGGYEKLLQEESTVGCIVFEIPAKEKAIESSISYVPHLIKFEW